MALSDIFCDIAGAIRIGANLKSRSRLCWCVLLSRTHGVWSASSRLVPFRVEVLINGRRLGVCMRNNGSDIQVMTTVFTRGEYAAPGLVWGGLKTIVDAGANIGVASLLFSVLAPKARIVAIEPEACNFALLRVNMDGNQISADMLPAALWHSTGMIPLMIQTSAMSHSVVAGRKTSVGSAQVQSLDMATLLDQQGIDEVDLLKCDIEGAEAEVFRKSGPWIRRVKHIIVEAHSGKGCPSEVICEILRNHSFQTVIYGASDNLIYAKRITRL